MTSSALNPTHSTLRHARVLRLEGTLQNYAWGDTGAIPELLGIETAGPVAEYWMGAHVRSPSTASTGVGAETVRLDELISSDPDYHLGGRRPNDDFPFLLKILAAAQPLSIQTHPSAEQAVAGFSEEEAEGIAIDAPERVFRDRSAKPELIVALDRFEARVGFRPTEETRVLLDVIARADPKRWTASKGDELHNVFVTGGYGAALRWLTSLGTEAERSLSDAVVAAASTLEHHGATDRALAGDGQTALIAARHHPGDVGIVILLLLNRIVLQPGEGIFLPAGTLHAYVQGVGVEVMANSDNVIRGGLTTKHIDTDRLVALTTTEPETPVVQVPASAVHRYRSDDSGFSLIGLHAGHYTSVAAGPKIVVVTDGMAQLRSGGDEHEVAVGQAVYIPAGAGAFDISTTGRAWLAEGTPSD